MSLFPVLHSGSPAKHAEVAFRTVARVGDQVMVATLGVSALAALAIGLHFGQGRLAGVAAAGLLVSGLIAFFAARGTWLSQGVLVAANAAMVALHIQLGRGTVEFHFGVFVLLGMVLVYRDWRPLVLAAGLFAVHHIVFDRLQAAGWPVYCTPEPDFLKMLMHASYVVAQTGIEIVLALHLRRASHETAELSALVRHLDRGNALCLDVARLPASTDTAALLKAALLKMNVAMADVSRASAAIERASAEIATGNIDLSRRTEAQAGSLQQTASSMEQLTGTVRNTAETAAEADVLARELLGNGLFGAQRFAVWATAIAGLVGFVGPLRGSGLACHLDRETTKDLVRGSLRSLSGIMKAFHDYLTVRRINRELAFNHRLRFLDDPSGRVLGLEHQLWLEHGAAVAESRVGHRHLERTGLEIALTDRELDVLADHPGVVILRLFLVGLIQPFRGRHESF